MESAAQESVLLSPFSAPKPLPSGGAVVELLAPPLSPEERGDCFWWWVRWREVVWSRRVVVAGGNKRKRGGRMARERMRQQLSITDLIKIRSKQIDKFNSG